MALNNKMGSDIAGRFMLIPPTYGTCNVWRIPVLEQPKDVSNRKSFYFFLHVGSTTILYI
jgi:hypothetical protein